MRNMIVTNSKNDVTSFSRSVKISDTAIKSGILGIMLQIYGFKFSKNISKVSRLLSGLYTILIHLIPIYIFSMSIVMLNQFSSFDEAAALGFAIAGILPLVLNYVIRSKMPIIYHIMDQYGRFKSIQEVNSRSYKEKIVNITVAFIILSSLIASTSTTVSLTDNKALDLYYSCYMNFEDKILGTCFRFCMIQLLFAHQYVYPCIISLMCCALFYEFSEFLQRFRQHLQDDWNDLNEKKMVVAKQLYATLLEIAHELHDATSMVCFILLSCHLTIIYCSLAIFVLTKNEDLTTSQICENCLMIVLIPAAIFGIVLSAARIGTQHRKIEAKLSLLKNKLNLENENDLEKLHFVKLITEDKFPVMSAFGLGELTPNFILSIFGSLLTYSLLILNFKK